MLKCACTLRTFSSAADLFRPAFGCHSNQQHQRRAHGELCELSTFQFLTFPLPCSFFKTRHFSLIVTALLWRLFPFLLSSFPFSALSITSSRSLLSPNVCDHSHGVSYFTCVLSQQKQLMRSLWHHLMASFRFPLFSILYQVFGNFHCCSVEVPKYVAKMCLFSILKLFLC